MTRGQLFLALCLCCGAAAGGLAGDWLDQPPRGAVYGVPEAVAWADHTLGTNIDGGRLNPAAREAFFRQAQWGQPNSLRWLRVPIRWADVQKSPPKEGSATASDDDWSGLDTFLAEAESRGFKVWAVLGDSPVWARDPQQPASAPPKDGRAFGAFARVVATRYRSKIAAYQIWDEPNLASGWGGQYPDPAAYAGLLREAAINIRAADPRAIIVSAALSPTTENGPLNLNEPEYLRRLYRAGARDFFDAVAAEPFGFWTDPDDRRINTGILNFSRLVLLREVMQAQADSQKAIWAAAFGWAALRQAPDPSRGQAQDAARGEGDPAFGGDSPQTQAVRTAAAIQMARDEWPWLGPLVFTRWQAEGERDPRAGFALFGLDGTPSPLGLPLMSEAAAKPVLTAGRYAPDDARIAYPSTWRVLSDGADAPQNDLSPVVMTFRGTRLDLTVRRGPYRGYLWVTIDSAPANSLPRDEQGRSFVVLYDPLAQAAEVTLAHGLSDSEHRAEISAEGGWGQWPIASWTVARERDSLSLPTWLGVGLGAVAGAIAWRVSASARRRVGAWARERGTRNAQQVVERAVWVGLFGSGALFYLSPNIALSWLLLALLALFTLWQPVGGLALIAFAIPFYVQPTSLGIGSYAVVEVVVVLCAAGYLGRGLVALMRSPRARAEHFWRTRASRLWRQLSVMDWVVLGWVACGVIGVMSAENVGVANREFRVVIVEPALYYAMIRASRANVRPLINAFLAGATVIAVKAVADWITQSDLIAAEGVLRARSVYFSPNNLALYLDRAVALALPLALFGRTRRAWYGAACAVMVLALYLTFAKGTWLIALPMALLFIGLTRGRKVLLGSLGVLALIVVSLLPIAGTERLRSLLDLSGGTGFIRLQLWQSALAMIRDHPLWGVGLDNFLYQYRTRYILPAAFAEPGLSHPHNILLDFWTRLGLPGVGLLLFMLTAFWRRARAVYRRLPEGDARALALGVMAAMVAALAHGLIDNSFFLVDLAFVLMLTLAVLERLWVEAQLISTA